MGRTCIACNLGVHQVCLTLLMLFLPRIPTCFCACGGGHSELNYRSVPIRWNEG